TQGVSRRGRTRRVAGPGDVHPRTNPGEVAGGSRAARTANAAPRPGAAVSVVDAATPATIEERAGFRCEYCRLPVRGLIATFPIDHPTPRSNGGLTVLTNLALACPHCNGHKWAHTSAPDPTSAEVVPLFNPRVDRWEEHFQWSA